MASFDFSGEASPLRSLMDPRITATLLTPFTVNTLRCGQVLETRGQLVPFMAP